jgi:hypothetical protein
MAVIWVVAPCSLEQVYHLKVNVNFNLYQGKGELTLDHTALQPRRQPSSGVFFIQSLVSDKLEPNFTVE